MLRFSRNREVISRPTTQPTKVSLLHLEGELIHKAVGSPASVGQPRKPTLLAAIENLVACLAGNSKLPAEFRHLLAG
jgi:hypothetical protein